MEKMKEMKSVDFSQTHLAGHEPDLFCANI